MTLPLTRFDLGDYLGVAAETVIRTFASLERNRIIYRLSSRLIEIRDIEALKSPGKWAAQNASLRQNSLSPSRDLICYFLTIVSVRTDAAVVKNRGKGQVGQALGQK